MSDKIYKHQTEVTITVTMKNNDDSVMNLTGHTAIIKYRKPSGDVDEVTPVDQSPADGILTYLITEATFLDESGDWAFWGYIVFPNTKEAPGEPFTYTIYVEGY